MSSGAHKTITLRQVDAVFANLDLSEVAEKYLMDDMQLTARKVVKRYYPQLLEMQQQGFTYEKLCAFLFDTFEFSITPRTLRNYMNEAKALEEAKRSTQVPPKRQARSRKPKASAPIEVEAMVASAPPVHPLIEVTPAVAPIAAKPPAAKPASSKSSGPRSQPPPVAPSDAIGDTPIVEFSLEELEAALQIPKPGNTAATEKFLQALQQLKTVDPNRWRKLKIQAENQGINVLGIIMPASGHLFNQY